MGMSNSKEIGVQAARAVDEVFGWYNSNPYHFVPSRFIKTERLVIIGERKCCLWICLEFFQRNPTIFRQGTISNNVLSVLEK